VRPQRTREAQQDGGGIFARCGKVMHGGGGILAQGEGGVEDDRK
jgi:hypothetical protein